MSHLSDELINKYIDKEASNEELNIINGHLAVCGECSYKIKAARLAESALHKMAPSALSENFTENVMAKLTKAEVKSARPEGSFIKIIFSLFILAIGGAVGYGLSLAFASGDKSASETGPLNDLLAKGSDLFTGLRFPAEFKLFQNSEIAGVVIVIMLLTAGYYLYESHKELKKRAGNLR